MIQAVCHQLRLAHAKSPQGHQQWHVKCQGAAPHVIRSIIRPRQPRRADPTRWTKVVCASKPLSATMMASRTLLALATVATVTADVATTDVTVYRVWPCRSN